MVTNFNSNSNELSTPVIFREDFKEATLSATQAWSLFFSAGQEENLFGQEREIGWFYNNLLLAGGLMFGLSAMFFSAPMINFYVF